MQPTINENPRRSLIPPWSIMLVQCIWIITSILAFRTGLATSNLWHFLMGCLVGPILAVGLYCRWRWSLWVSAIFFAAAFGGTMAHRVASLGDGIGSQQADLLFIVALIVQGGGWFIHQISISFSWLAIARTRSMRLGFMLLSFLAFCLWALLAYRVPSQQV